MSQRACRVCKDGLWLPVSEPAITLARGLKKKKRERAVSGAQENSPDLLVNSMPERLQVVIKDHETITSYSTIRQVVVLWKFVNIFGGASLYAAYGSVSFFFFSREPGHWCL